MFFPYATISEFFEDQGDFPENLEEHNDCPIPHRDRNASCADDHPHI